MCRALFLLEIIKKGILLRLGKLLAPRNTAFRLYRIFRKTRSLVAFGVIPLVKALGDYVPAVFAVDERAFPVIAPRSGKVDGAFRYLFSAEYAAAVKHKAYLLLQRVRGSCYITMTAYLKERFDIAVFKQRVAAAEDKINGSRDIAVSEYLALIFSCAQFVL